MNKTMGKLILALETAIDGGSVAILRGGETLGRSEGTGGVSKSEDLLSMLEELLNKNALKKEEIGTIAVSDSPGSATGIRIGLATARGLGDALPAKVSKLSILEAQVVVSGAAGQIISAIYSERNGIFYCRYQDASGKFTAVDEIQNERDASAFVQMIGRQHCRIVSDERLARFLRISRDYQKIAASKKFQVIEGSLAQTIGIASAKNASDNEVS